MTRDEALRRVVFLKESPAATRARIAAAGHTHSLAPGETLFGEGDPSIGLTVVLTGAVKEFKLDTRGRELVLALHGPGASPGELPLFDGGNHPTYAAATAAGATLFRVPASHFQALLHTDPVLCAAALRALAIQQRKLLEMLKAQALHTVRARLAAYLLHQADGETTLRLADSNETIAAQVGTVREVISRTLHQLADQGAVRIDGRRVIVLDRPLLEKIAAEG